MSLVRSGLGELLEAGAARRLRLPARRPGLGASGASSASRGSGRRGRARRAFGAGRRRDAFGRRRRSRRAGSCRCRTRGLGAAGAGRRRGTRLGRAGGSGRAGERREGVPFGLEAGSAERPAQLGRRGGFLFGGEGVGGRGAGVDGPAGAALGGPVPAEVVDGLVEVVGDDVDGAALAGPAHRDVGEFPAAAVLEAVGDVDGGALGPVDGDGVAVVEPVERPSPPGRRRGGGRRPCGREGGRELGQCVRRRPVRW